MAKVGSFKDGFISVNGTTLSDHAQSIVIEDSAEEVDITGFTSAGYREFDDGLKDVTITANFFQDFATGSVDSLLNTMYSTGSAGTIIVRPTSAAASSTNPSYTLVAKLFSYGPVAGAVGDAMMVECAFRHSGTLGLVRGTS